MNAVVFDADNPDPSQQNNQVLMPMLIDNLNERLDLTSRIEKRIKKIRYTLSVDYGISSFRQQVNNVIQYNKSNNYGYELGAETLFEKFPTLELGYKRTVGDFKSGSSSSTFVQSEPFVKIDYSFLNGFLFNFDYTAFNYRNKAFGQKNNFEIANATLSYQKENSPWAYKLLATNIFDARFKQNGSFSDFVVSDTRTFIFPRVFVLSVTYKL